MNRKGGFIMGMMVTLVFFILILALFGMIEPLKENFDTARGSGSTLNCPGTPTHDPVDYANDTTEQKLIRRPVCFVTGLGLVWFVGAFLIASVIWVFSKWTGR